MLAVAKKIGYKPAMPNINKGLKTHGSFVSSVKGQGQKPGKQGANAGKPAKESIAPMEANVFMKKVVADLRKNGKRRISMLPDTGAFH